MYIQSTRAANAAPCIFLGKTRFGRQTVSTAGKPLQKKETFIIWLINGDQNTTGILCVVCVSHTHKTFKTINSSPINPRPGGRLIGCE